MTLNEIKALLVSVDSGIRHYFTMSDAEAYTYWEEGQLISRTGDDRHPVADQAWRFYVHRFTRTEGDSTIAALFEALDQDPRTTVKWITDFDKESGYIHHILECEAY